MPTFMWIPIGIAAILYWRMCFRWAIEADADSNHRMTSWGRFWGEVVLVTVCAIIPFIPYLMFSDYRKRTPQRQRRFDPARAARVIGGESRHAKIKRLEAKNAEAQKVIRDFEAGRI